MVLAPQGVNTVDPYLHDNAILCKLVLVANGFFSEPSLFRVYLFSGDRLTKIANWGWQLLNPDRFRANEPQSDNDNVYW